jgi:ABC-type antimicrobial peptide transport system ATPase subunit
LPPIYTQIKIKINQIILEFTDKFLENTRKIRIIIQNIKTNLNKEEETNICEIIENVGTNVSIKLRLERRGRREEDERSTQQVQTRGGIRGEGTN